MSRIKKAIDYINELRSNDNPKKQMLGKELAVQYAKWTKTLNLKDFLAFAKIIQENKTEIGAAQFFGKFRAYALEEYIYRLLQTKVRFPEPLQVFWGEKCLVWQKGREKYSMEFDVAIGKKAKGIVEPKIVFDAKVELDSARLKTALASFAILKRWNAEVKCLLVYVVKDVDSVLLKLANYWVDGLFRLNLQKDETRTLLDYVSKCLS
ncbi:MAG: hypothetical protein ACPLW8_00330 [Candidatus Bathyarchaeales archaeon]